jgi:hypothetical protein
LFALNRDFRHNRLLDAAAATGSAERNCGVARDEIKEQL